MKRISTKELKTEENPWINRDILKKIRVRNKLHARKKRQPNNNDVKRCYNLIRNEINRDIAKAKKKYYEDYFTSHVDDIKKTWEGIRQLVNIKKQKHTTTRLKVGGKIIDNDKDLANNFNNFYVNVGSNTEKYVTKAPNVSSTKYLNNRIHSI